MLGDKTQAIFPTTNKMPPIITGIFLPTLSEIGPASKEPIACAKPYVKSPALIVLSGTGKLAFSVGSAGKYISTAIQTTVDHITASAVKAGAEVSFFKIHRYVNIGEMLYGNYLSFANFLFPACKVAPSRSAKGT